MPTIYIILGSIREGRNGEKVANWLLQIAKKRTDMNVELIDLRDWPLPMFAHGGFPSQGDIAAEAKPWAEKIAKADGFVWVTSEYNHGYPASLKNAIDHIYKEWNHKAVALASYGSAAGGVRAAEQLRMVAAELKMVDTRETVVIPHVYAAFDDNGQPKHEGLNKAADTLFTDLLWWTNATMEARAKS